MKYKYFFLFSLFLFLTFFTFFYKLIFFKQVPFPGDLLIATAPYKAESYLGYSPGGYPNKGQGRDVIDQLYPWKYFVIAQEKKLQLPVWNPFNFSGNIAMQNYQSAPFYPINILFFIFPFQIAWVIYVLLQPVLAMIFMYLFLREIKISFIASCLGSLAFAFSSYMVVWFEYGNIGHAFLWLPLILVAAKKILEAKKFLLWFVMLFFSLLFSFLAGYIQGTFYILVIVTSFFLAKSIYNKNTNIYSFFSFGIAIVVCVLVASSVLLPTLDFFHYSTRGGYSFAQILQLLNPWYFLTTLFASDFFGNPATRNYLLQQTYYEHVLYVGVPTLFFAMYAIEKVKNFYVNFFTVLGGLTLILTTNIPGVGYLYLIPFPLISTTIPTRALCIFIFCFIVVAAWGIDYWQKTREIKAYVPFIFSGIYTLLWILVLFLPKFMPNLQSNFIVSKHNLLIPSALAIGTIFSFYTIRRFGKISIILLVFLVGFDLFYFFSKFTPFSPVDFMFPQNSAISFLQKNSGIYRSYGFSNALIPPNYQTVQGIYSPEGFDALHIKEYTELLETSGTGKLSGVPSRTDANIAPISGIDDFKNNTFRQKMLNLLGVKYILDEKNDESKDFDYGNFDKEKYALVWQQGKLQIYENKHVLPRFFLTSNYVIKKTQKEQIAAVYSEDLRKTVILAENPFVPLDSNATGSVRLLSYTPNNVTFSTELTGNQLLFLSDTYYHDWIAKVDGNATPIYKADYAFRAVEIPKGVHTVIFSFIPASFYKGILIACGGVIFFLGYLLYMLVFLKNKALNKGDFIENVQNKKRNTK